jgi:hypothetical protein
VNTKRKTNIYNKNNKMKKSELKEIIRTSLLEEMEYDVPSTYTDKDLDDLLSIVLKYVEDPNDAEEEIAKFDAGGFDAMSDYVTANLLRDKDYNDWYNKLHSIKEAEEEEDKEEEDVEVEDEVEVTADEKEGIDVKQDADSDLTGVVGNVQDNLEAALEAARKLGDEKLVDQIGNTLTFFTRNHVVKEEAQIDVDVDSPAEDAEIGMKLDESIIRMRKLAGLIK